MTSPTAPVGTDSAGTVPGTSIYGTLPQTSSSSAAASANDPGKSDILSNGMGTDTFLQLLVAQLKYQNPLSPTDGTQFMSQLAQFAQVEKLNDISAAQSDASSWQRAVVGEGLIGKTVTGTDMAGNPVTDTVSGLQITSTGPLLTLTGGGSMDVQAVTTVEPANSVTPATTITHGGGSGATGT